MIHTPLPSHTHRYIHIHTSQVICMWKACICILELCWRHHLHPPQKKLSPSAHQLSPFPFGKSKCLCDKLSNHLGLAAVQWEISRLRVLEHDLTPFFFFYISALNLRTHTGNLTLKHDHTVYTIMYTIHTHKQPSFWKKKQLQFPDTANSEAQTNTAFSTFTCCAILMSGYHGSLGLEVKGQNLPVKP